MTNLSGAGLNSGAAVGPQGEGRDCPSTFPKYPAYKDSRVPWIGEVPAAWEVKPFKWLLDSNDGGVWGDDPTGEGDTLVLRSTDQTVDGNWKLTDPAPRNLSAKERASALLIEGDLVVTKSSGSSLHIGKTTLVTADIAKQGCCYGNFMQRLRVNSSFTPKLAWYVMNNELARAQLDLLSNSTTGLANLNGTLIGEILLPVSTVAEQTQIARFLDHETARIDALIEEQQRLIELLKEKRQAVISHAVTKGLDPTVPMKDSGVEWLGEVPAHWKVSKLGHYAQIVTGFPFPSASFSHDESDVRLLRGANIGVGSLKWIDTVYWELNEGDELSSYLMEEGQIVLGMDRPWISEGMRIARVTQDDMPCLLLQRVAAITPNAGISDEYLYCLLASELFKAYVEPDLTGVSVPHISPEQILSFQIPVPHIDEQRKISRFIKDQLDQMSALFQQASESVELLQERRSALISAAVTGKIDVRNG